VNLDAVRHNVEVLRSRAPDATFMAVVKADGYGHGVVEVAKACREAGSEYLGVALPSEAIQLRNADFTGPILAWLYTPGDDLIECAERGIELSASSLGMLEHIAATAKRTDTCVQVHLKVDTGLGRNGCLPGSWPELLTAAKRLEAAGTVEIVGIWSHLACADDPSSNVTAEQVAVFELALEVAQDLGVDPQFRHLANSAGVIEHPDTHYNLVRCGIAVYGLSPSPEVGTSEALGLIPAMTARASVALVKSVPAGQGVSYGLRYRTQERTKLALIPVGYADGLPRSGSGNLPLQIGGERFTVAGTVAMDQVVLDVGDAPVSAGDAVELFGNGAAGAPTADDWARACGTINYEIVTRLGSRIPRDYAEEGS
jgi:alanine racemase